MYVYTPIMLYIMDLPFPGFIYHHHPSSSRHRERENECVGCRESNCGTEVNNENEFLNSIFECAVVEPYMCRAYTLCTFNALHIESPRYPQGVAISILTMPSCDTWK